MSDNLRFAVCFMSPGTSESDVVNAARLHRLHILNRLPLTCDKEYTLPALPGLVNNAWIFSVYVFPEETILVEDDASLNLTLRKIEELSGMRDN